MPIFQGSRCLDSFGHEDEVDDKRVNNEWSKIILMPKKFCGWTSTHTKDILITMTIDRHVGCGHRSLTSAMYYGQNGQIFGVKCDKYFILKKKNPEVFGSSSINQVVKVFGIFHPSPFCGHFY